MQADAKLHPAIASAYELWQTFTPDPETEYDWIIELSKEKYKDLESKNDKIESKATWVFSLGTGSAGLISFASVVAIASTQITYWVAVVSLLPFLALVIAMAFAVSVRMLLPAGEIPSGTDAIRRAHHYPTQKLARGAMLVEWQIASAWLTYTVMERGARLSIAMWCFVVGIGLTALPIAFAAFSKSSVDATQTTTPIPAAK